jgi:hypothetical protein
VRDAYIDRALMHAPAENQRLDHRSSGLYVDTDATGIIPLFWARIILNFPRMQLSRPRSYFRKLASNGVLLRDDAPLRKIAFDLLRNFCYSPSYRAISRAPCELPQKVYPIRRRLGRIASSIVVPELDGGTNKGGTRRRTLA